VDRRNTTSRPGSVAETLQVPVISYARSRARRARTPVRPTPVVIEPDGRDGQQEPLAHPRLVRRSQPQIAVADLPRDLEDEPTGLR
jgi:hypothetical protein